MRCFTVRKRLPKYQDGDLPEQQVREIDEHLRACEACAHELEQFDGVLGLLGGLTELETPADFTRDVMAAVIAEPEMEAAEEPERPAVALWLGSVGIAVSVLGIALLAVGVPAGLLDAIGPLSSWTVQTLSLAADVGMALFDVLLVILEATATWIIAIDLALVLAVLGAWQKLNKRRLAREMATFLAA